MEWLDPVFYLDWIPDANLISDVMAEIFHANALNILVGSHPEVWDGVQQETEIIVEYTNIGGEFPAMLKLSILATHLQRPTTLEDIGKLSELLQGQIAIDDPDTDFPMYYLLVNGKSSCQPVIIDYDINTHIVVLGYR